MSKLRVTYIVEYEVDPVDYGVETMEQAAEEERAALNSDFAGTLLNLSENDGYDSLTVEVVP